MDDSTKWAAVPIVALLAIALLADPLSAGRDAGVDAADAGKPSPSSTPANRTVPPQTAPPQPSLTVVDEHQPPVEVQFRAAAHTAFQFDSEGNVVAETTYDLDHDSTALADAEIVDSRGNRYFRMVSGVFEGYLVPASDVVFLPEPSRSP